MHSIILRRKLTYFKYSTNFLEKHLYTPTNNMYSILFSRQVDTTCILPELELIYY